MTGALVLNATYEPMCVVPLRRAVVLVLAEKAMVVEAGEQVLHAEHVALPVPSVVRLHRYVRVPHRRVVPLTRKAVFERDQHRCAYCGGRADSVDHVVPRSRSGPHEWTNVVAACQRCNSAKADSLLSEIGWELPFTPRAPTSTLVLLSTSLRREPTWLPYLQPWAPARDTGWLRQENAG